MILLLCDAQNLFYSVRDLFGNDARVDFKKLIEAARSNREHEEVRPIAYLAQYQQGAGPTDTGVISAFKATGYEVRVRQVKQRPGGKFSSPNTDSDIILDAMDLVTKCDIKVVVIASGDRDFVPLYQKLKERGIRVEVLAFQDSLSGELMRHVDEIRLLGASILFDVKELPNGSVEAGAAESGGRP